MVDNIYHVCQSICSFQLHGKKLGNTSMPLDFERFENLFLNAKRLLICLMAFSHSSKFRLMRSSSKKH
jgi:hypothetical protein